MKRVDQSNAKDIAIGVAVGIIILAIAFLVVGCGTGTVVTFGKDGIEIQPPAGPIIIPTK
jgi:hypothetical protein